MSKNFLTFLANVEVSEEMLLRDIVFIFQGINGQFIKYNTDSSSYIIDPKVCTNNYWSLFLKNILLSSFDMFIILSIKTVRY